MPKEYNIRWNDNQRKKLNSAVRRYNNALRRAKIKNPENAEFLPSEVKYKELKANISARRALKNTVNRLLRATKPGALDLVRQEDASIITKYERREFSILKSVRERKKSMKAKKLSLDAKTKGIGNLAAAKLSPDKRKISSMSAGSIKRFIETQEKELNASSVEKARQYFSNYMSALRTVFGGFEEYDELIDGIEERVLELASKDFEALEKAIDDAPSIKFIYDPIARDAKIMKLYEFWSSYDY